MASAKQKKWLFVGEVDDVLESGRPVAPGDQLDPSALDFEKGAHDIAHRDEGRLIEVSAPKEEANP